MVIKKGKETASIEEVRPNLAELSFLNYFTIWGAWEREDFISRNIWPIPASNPEGGAYVRLYKFECKEKLIGVGYIHLKAKRTKDEFRPLCNVEIAFAVHPFHRKKGYGERIIWLLIDLGQNLGNELYQNVHPQDVFVYCSCKKENYNLVKSVLRKNHFKHTATTNHLLLFTLYTTVKQKRD